MAFLPSMPDADMKRTLAHEPAIGIPFSQLNEAVMRGDAPFSAGERELIAAYVSALNGCDYCQCEHAALAAAFGLPVGILAQLLQDGDTGEVSERFRAPWSTPGSSRSARRSSVPPMSRPCSRQGMMNGPCTFWSS
jgi:AhpD family alkylhydroperoxidase